MEIVNLNKETFEELINRFEVLTNKVKLIQELNKDKILTNWLDSHEVCKILNISPRTLQTYRNNGKIGFSQINQKIYYKHRDVQKLLEDNYKNKQDNESN